MNRRASHHAALALALLIQAGCRAEPAAEPRDEAVAPEAPRDAWVVTPTGIGPVRVGMTVAEARAALGGALQTDDSLDAYCHHMVLPGTPGRVLAMVVDGRIVRVEVGDSLVATERGARVGSTEAAIDSIYPGQVAVEPHKYTDGNYLLVTPREPADSLYRLVFETDGQRVTEYRAGRLPEVRWVEGCS